jgi:single-strand DNA-binding protein
MNLNKVMLIGRLGKKPEVNYFKPDTPVARFSLATSEYYTSKEGAKMETTEWHNIVAWRGTAKLAENYLDKGMLVYVEGRLQTRKWDTPEGTTRYSTEITADTIKILEKKSTNIENLGSSTPVAKTDAPTTKEEDPFKDVSPELNQDADDDLPF